MFRANSHSIVDHTTKYFPLKELWAVPTNAIRSWALVFSSCLGRFLL